MPVFIPPGPGITGPSDSTTTSELVEEALTHLNGFTSQVGQVTWLANGVGPDDLTFTVEATTEGAGLSRGIAEIGDELVFVSGSEAGTVTLAPFGRGYRNTQAKPWPAGTEVTMSPRFPRASVLNAINQVLLSIFPQLYGVKSYELAWNPIVETFELPDDAEEILAVDWDPTGPQASWYPIDNYRFLRDAPTSDFSTGKALQLGESPDVGRTVRVLYMSRPTALTDGGTFTDTGLELSAWPAILYGALHRLAAPLTLGQLSNDSASSLEYQRTRPMNAVDVSRQYFALHQQFVDAERARLQNRYPTRITWDR